LLTPIHPQRDLSEEDPLAAPLAAAHAAESKKAVGIRVLDLREISSFTDFFVVCTGTNQKQIQAIADEIESVLKQNGRHALGIEGYEKADWVLVDYGDFIIHIFSQQARGFYDLERLWRAAKEVRIPEMV
jgi:ribosome-associated protein